MNVGYLKGCWKPLKGDLRSEFGEPTDEKVMQAHGKTDALMPNDSSLDLGDRYHIAYRRRSRAVGHCRNGNFNCVYFLSPA